MKYIVYQENNYDDSMPKTIKAIVESYELAKKYIDYLEKEKKEKDQKQFYLYSRSCIHFELEEILEDEDILKLIKE